MKVKIHEPDILTAKVGETGAFMLELDFTPEAWHKLYAGMALQGLLSGDISRHAKAAEEMGYTDLSAYFVKRSQQLADAMKP